MPTIHVRRYGTQQRAIPTGKGKCLIMAHIGSYEKGLVQNGELIFESKSTDENGDYHKDMDSNEFERYVPFVVLETNIENQMQKVTFFTINFCFQSNNMENINSTLSASHKLLIIFISKGGFLRLLSHHLKNHP